MELSKNLTCLEKEWIILEEAQVYDEILNSEKGYSIYTRVPKF